MKRVAYLLIGACLAVAVLHADYLEVRRAAVLKGSPERDGEEIARVEPGTKLNLLSNDQQNGYYQVENPQTGEAVWIYRTLVRRYQGNIPLPKVATTVGSEPWLVKSGPCVADGASCPDTGCAQPGTPQALMNLAKHHRPTGPVVALTFDDFAALQQIADDRGIPTGHSSNLSAAQRQRLTGMTLGNRTVGEGDHAQLVAYITRHRNLREAGGESVNCRLKGFANNDVHIPLVPEPNLDEYRSVVAEPIPDGRPAAWTLAEFKRIQREGRLVMIRGNLFFDNQHRIHDDPENEEGLASEPKRFTVWEIHPITEIFECQRPNNACDPKVESQWKALR